MIIEQGSAAFTEVLRVSRHVFGNQDRLVVAAAIAGSEPGQIYGRSIAERIGIADSRVGTQLGQFEQAGLLVKMPKVADERRVYYERVESAFWDAAAVLAHEIVARTE